MSIEPNKDLIKRVAQAMAAVLSRDGSLTYPKLLVEMGILRVKDLEGWRRGKVPHLERVVHMNLTKLSRVQTAVRRIARERGLIGRLDAASPRHPYSKARNPIVEAEYGMVYRKRPEPTSPPRPAASGPAQKTSPPASTPPPAVLR